MTHTHLLATSGPIDRITDPMVELLITGPALVGVSLALLVASVLAWTGRWRAWARQPYVGTMPIHLLPGLGLLSGFAAAEVFFDLPDPEQNPLINAYILLAIATIMVGGVVYGLGLWGREPKWAQPTWLKTADRSVDIEGDIGNALFHLAANIGTHHRTRAAVEEAFAGQEQLARWAAAHVFDPAATAPTRVLSGVGTLDGRLALYPNGLGFYPVAIEEHLRMSEDGCLLLVAEELTAVWTVPARSDAAGVRVRVPLRYRYSEQGPYRRLVIGTQDGPEVFQVAKARAKADELAQRYGIERAADIERPRKA